MNTGNLHKVIYSKKYGVELTRWTHAANSVICASKNGFDESIRYLSLFDNRYIRYFKGHRDKVVSLAMSPINDTFMSGAVDDTVRLWDLRTNVCQGLLRIKGRPCVSFDPQGLVFTAAISSNTIKLYDTRSFDKGPFDTFYIKDHKPVEWMSLKFSNDGKYLLLSTGESAIFLIDAFTGQKLQVYTGHVNDNGSQLEASFSPDAQFVISGSEDGTVHVWQTQTGKEVAVWRGHAGAVGAVQWDPRKMCVASACTNLVFWLPPPEQTLSYDKQNN
mmetsp:Transcript_17422/g.28613  ORF Transcript_17422/g.28613 Transcript_17422/m.28613 type:complete len:274 (+) Transcript_17422:203-1024(+)